MTDKDSEEMENTNYGNGWTTVFNSEQPFAELTPPEISENVGVLSRPPSGTEELNSSNEYYDNMLDPLTRQMTRYPGLNEYFAPSIGTYYGTQPLILPDGETSVLVSSSAPNPQVPTTNPQVPTTSSQVPTMNPQVPITNPQLPNINTESSNIPTVQIPTSIPQQHNMMTISNVNWQAVGILLAFIKLGLVKLKALGFIKTLLFFLFKLKLLLIHVFLKSILIFNMLVFKLFMFPLFLLPSLPIIASLISPTFIIGILSIPQKIAHIVQGYFAAFTPAATNAIETSSSSSSMASPLNSGKTTIIPGSTTKTSSLFITTR